MNGGSRRARRQSALASLLAVGMLAGVAAARPATAGAATGPPPMYLTASTPAVAAGAPLTLTATVATAAPGSFTFSFFEDGAQQGCTAGPTQAGPSSLGQTCTIPQVSGPTGVQTFTATYTPAGSSQPAATAAVEVTVLPGLTSTTVTAPAVAAGSSLTYTASVASPVGNVTTGSVRFSDDGTTIATCSAVPVSAGAAACTLPSGYPNVGTHDVEAAYVPDTAVFGPSVAATVEAVGAVASGTTPTTTSLTVSDPDPALGQAVTLGATVTSTASPASPPTGTVTFTDEGTALPGCQDVPVVPSSGTDQSGATCAIAGGFPAVATSVVQALFLPTSGSTLDGSASPARMVQPRPAPVALTLSATPDPAPSGTPVTLRIGLASPIPSTAGSLDGPVQVDLNGKSLACAGAGTGQIVLTGGSVSCTLDGLGVGTSTVTAAFLGGSGSGDAAGAQAQLPLTVDTAPPTTTVSLSATPDPATVNTKVTYTATVSGTSGSTPTGTVTFTDVTDGTTLCTAPLVSGSALCSLPSGYPTAGVAVVSATYGGDSANPAAAGSLSVPVDNTSSSTSAAAAPNFALNASPTAVLIGQPLTYTASVTNPTGGAPPSGSVTFSDDGAPIAGCTSLPIGPPTAGSDTAQAMCTISGGYPAILSHTVVASYDGSNSWLPVSAALFITPIGADPGIGMSVDQAPQSGSGSLLVAASFASRATLPTGTVAISDLGTGTGCPDLVLAPSPPVCDLPLPPASSGEMLVASYSGDGTYLPAVAALGEQTTVAGSAAPGLTLSATPSASGVRLHVAVSASSPTPTGSVQLVADGSPLSACGPGGVVGLTAGSATCSTGSSLPAGVHTVVATYSGDGTYRPSGALAEVVVPAATSSGTGSGGSGPGGGGGGGGGAPAGGSGSSTAGGGGGSAGAGGGGTASGGGVGTGAAGSTGPANPNETGSAPPRRPAAPTGPAPGATAGWPKGGGSTRGGSPAGRNAPALHLRIPLAAPVSRPVVFRLRVHGAKGPLKGTVTFRVDGRPVRGCSAVRLGGGDLLQVTCRLPGGLATPGYQVVTAAYSGGGGYARTSATAVEQIVPPWAGGWLVARSGRLAPVGGAPTLAVRPSASPVVAAAMAPDARGLWVLSGDGSVQATGAARPHGSAPARGAPYTAIAPTRDGGGYWILARDGSVVRRGDARALGGTRATATTGPFVALAPTPDGAGYWLLSSRGDVVARGDAATLAPPTPVLPARPYVALAPTLDGRGYTLLTAAGHLVAAGDAPPVPTRALPRSPGGYIALLRLAGHPGLWAAERNGTLVRIGGAPAPTLRTARPPGPFVALAGT